MPTFNDPNLIFTAKDHRYQLQDQPDLALTSVTQIVKSYSHSFDADTEAAKYAIKHRLKKVDVLRAWEDKRDRSAAAGTAVHAEAERIANELYARGAASPVFGDGEYDNFMDGVRRFYDDHPEVGLSGPIAEARICHPGYQVAGLVDLLASYESMSALLDWKTSEKMAMFGYGSTTMYSPYNKLPDSNFWHYAVQLNIYSFILKEIYAYEIDFLGIIWLRNDGTYRVIKVKVMPDLAEKGLKRHLNRMKKKEKENGTIGSD